MEQLFIICKGSHFELFIGNLSVMRRSRKTLFKNYSLQGSFLSFEATKTILSYRLGILAR